MRKKAIFRIRIITGAVLLLSLVLVGRLYYLQVLMHEHYLDEGEKQYVHTVRELFDRGAIFFKTKDGDRVSAATIQSGYVMAMDAGRINDPEKTYKELSKFIEVDKELFDKQVVNTNRTYQELVKRVDEDTANAIADENINGIQLYRTQWRYYPGGDLGARTVGFVGFTDDSGDQPVGIFGLENYYNEVLERSPHTMSVDFFAELFTNLGGTTFDSAEAREGDIITSIEPTVARMLDNQLLKTHEKYESALTGGIIINPQNGEIYAMNAVPSFDPNNRTNRTISDFNNPLVQDTYEMGSIIKALTVAVGLDTGAITAQTTYNDTGRIEVNKLPISNYDGRARGVVPMQEVLNQSLNTGVAHIVQLVGNKRFADYFRALKFGSETGIDLPYEVHGNIANLKSPRDVEYATASFGQGIAMTPIATVRALSALGNGGVLVTPHIATDIILEDGTVRPIKYPEGERVFTEETSEEISRMLTNVVDEALKGGNVKLENYSVGAKTGTAQMANPNGGGYYDDRYLHSFFGYFPAYDPEYLVFLYTMEPKGVQYASETLTDPFMEITKFLINYYNIPPDR